MGLALLAFDLACIPSAFWIAYHVRFGAAWHTVTTVGAGDYAKGASLLTAIWVALIWRQDGYARGFRGAGAPAIRLRTLLVTGCTAIGVLMAISFLYRDLLLSRQVYLTTTALALGAMIAARGAIRAVERDLASGGVGVRRILVLGRDAASREFAERLRDESPIYSILESPDGEAPIDLERIEAVHRAHPLDKIVLSLPALDRATPRDACVPQWIALLNFCEAEGISLYAIPNAFNVVVTEREVASLSGVPLIRLRDAAVHPAWSVVKRMIDVVAASAVLAVGMPLWATIAVVVRVTSRGPVFFRQTRIGLHGRPFEMYKFRSMRVGAEAEFGDLVDVDALSVPGVKLDADARVTPIGRWLRRTSLDEIPQLVNVLRGEMSLVGPRPEIPQLVARYDALQRRRLKGKPGITGFQQVVARNEPLAGAVAHDLTYLKEQGLLFDLYILGRTVPAMWRGR